MTTLTDHLRGEAFIASEGNGTISREKGTLASGQNLTAGTLLQGPTTAMVRLAADETCIGILIGDVDASDGALPAAYLSNDAEVVGSKLIYAADTTGTDEAVTGAASLALLRIKVR